MLLPRLPEKSMQTKTDEMNQNVERKYEVDSNECPKQATAADVIPSITSKQQPRSAFQRERLTEQPQWLTYTPQHAVVHRVYFIFFLRLCVYFQQKDGTKRSS